MNPFENSFATKDLLPKQQNGYPESAPGSSSGPSSGSTHANSETLTSTSAEKSSSTTTAPQSNIEKALPAPGAVPHIDTNGGSAVPPAIGSASDASSSSGNNKHNLRILNFQSLDSDRLPGLTPPLFTPGGRRLPPIQFSPNGALGSPGTPGHMWSSLLNATGSSLPGGQEALPQFINMMRKLGLTPNESNLRSGLTPSIMAQQGFNFNLNTPGGFLNGQMTPGLLNLLGLTASVPAQPEAAPNPGQEFQPPQVPQTSVPPPARAAPKQPEIKPDDSIEEESDLSEDEAVVKKEQDDTGKRVATDSGPNSKRAKNGVKTKATKKKKETKKSPPPSTEDEKRKQFLERNRVAASKCRQRKKQLFSKMESELSFYSNGYRELSVQVTQLRDQLLQLRGVLINHQDCNGLVNSVGGYRQMQTLLGQTDYIAQAAANSHPNYTSIPSTIPTTLNAQLPVKNESPIDGQVDVVPQMGANLNHVDGQASQGSPVGQGRHIGQVGGHVGPMGAIGQVGQMGGNGSPVNQVPHINGSQPPPQVGQPNGDMNMRMQYHQDVNGGNYQADLTQTGMNDLLNQGGNLRPINSTSNLQSEKLAASDSYGLRSVSSMADLQHGAHPPAVKHFNL